MMTETMIYKINTYFTDVDRVCEIINVGGDTKIRWYMFPESVVEAAMLNGNIKIVTTLDHTQYSGAEFMNIVNYCTIKDYTYL